MRTRKYPGAVRRRAEAFPRRAAGSIAVLAAVFSFLHLSPIPAEARSATDAEKAELAKAVAVLEQAFAKADYETIVYSTISPKLLAVTVPRDGAVKGDARQEIIKQTAKIMAGVQVEKFSMDVAAAQYRQDTNDQPFALIPTSTVMVIGDHRAISKGHTLALYEEGKWWLIRVEEKQLALVRKVYPEFAKVDFPRESVEIKK